MRVGMEVVRAVLEGGRAGPSHLVLATVNQDPVICLLCVCLFAIEISSNDKKIKDNDL